MPVISDTPGYLVVTDDIATSEFNVANKLLKLDDNVKAPFAQSLALSRATQPLNSKGNTYSTIQAAIDNMDVGGWVYVPPGTYTEALDIVGKDNLMLFGAGWGMSKITWAGNDHTLDIDNSNDVIIRDLRVDQATSDLKHCIRVDDAQRLKIQNVYFGDAGYSGVEFEDAASEECEITNCYFTGMESGGGIVDWNGAYASRLKISNSTFKNVPYSIFLASEGCIVMGNNIINDLNTAITISNTKYCICSNNTIMDSSYHGIVVTSSLHSMITDNISINNGANIPNYFSGILVHNTSNYTTVIGNVCYDDHSGCEGAGCQAYGIHVEVSDYNTINGNTCGDNLSDGIRVKGTVGNPADYNTLNSNICEGNGGKGIYIFGDKGSGNNYANKNIVVGNQLYDNTGTNLDDDGTSTQKGYNVTT